LDDGHAKRFEIKFVAGAEENLWRNLAVRTVRADRKIIENPGTRAEPIGFDMRGETLESLSKRRIRIPFEARVRENGL
jgi:hypothetical protein